MKVLVDTAAWIDFRNGYPSKERAALVSLIGSDDEICTCGVIVAEVFRGLKQDKGRKQLEGLFRKLAFLEPGGVDPYLRAAAVSRTLGSQGHPVRSTIDCLIAVLADEAGCYVLARDRDLGAILGRGLLKARLLVFPEPT